MQSERVDRPQARGLELILKYAVDQLMPLYARQAIEIPGDHHQFEMGVGGRPGMHVAFVAHFQVLRMKGSDQALVDAIFSCHGYVVCWPRTMRPHTDGARHDHRLVPGPHAQGTQGYHTGLAASGRRH